MKLKNFIRKFTPDLVEKCTGNQWRKSKGQPVKKSRLN